MSLQVAAVFPSSPTAGVSFPLVQWQVRAGFPSPVDDLTQVPLDLTAHVVRNPAATYFVRVAGESMEGVGITNGDLLVVDRSLTARDGSVVIAALDGHLTVKRLRLRDGQASLTAEHRGYSPLMIHEFTDFQIWGVVTTCIHAVR